MNEINPGELFFTITDCFECHETLDKIPIWQTGKLKYRFIIPKGRSLLFLEKITVSEVWDDYLTYTNHEEPSSTRRVYKNLFGKELILRKHPFYDKRPEYFLFLYTFKKRNKSVILAIPKPGLQSLKLLKEKIEYETRTIGLL